MKEGRCSANFESMVVVLEVPPVLESFSPGANRQLSIFAGPQRRETD